MAIAAALTTPKREKPLILTGTGDKESLNVMLAPLQQVFPDVVIKDQPGLADFCKQALIDLPDLIVFSPSNDVQEALDVLRKFPRGARPFRILIALGEQQESGRKACLDAGADDVVLRPIAEASERTVLHARIQTLLSGEYASELPFLTSSTPLGPMRLKCSARVLSLTDRIVKYACNANLLKGGRAQLNLGTISIIVTGQSSERTANGGYLVTAKIESVVGGEWPDLRRAILLLFENEKSKL